MASFDNNPRNQGTALTNLADQARMWWDGSPTSTRIISIGLAVLLMMCFAGAIMLASAPDYQDLFTNLDPHDAAAIAAKLDDAHVKYQMANDETSIKVPAADKDRLRMEMIRDGLPAKSGSVVSTDSLDKIGMSTTADVQDQYIRMAQETELSTTIASLNEVSSASVHISAGTNSPFAEEAAPPTASIVIGLKPGMTLTSDQVMGVANLVAKAVPALELKDVAVVDTDGNQLWDGGEQAGPSGMASNRLAAERQYSDELKKQMQSYLDAVLGPRKSIVSVHAELDYNQVHSDALTYGKGAVLSTQQTDEKYSGSANGAGVTVAGVASNTPGASVPQYPNGSPSSGHSGNYDHQVETDNYNNNKSEVDTQQAPGSIQKLAVAVLVDSSIPQATVSSIQTYLSTLAGVSASDPTRQVSVQSIPFSNTAVADQQVAMQKYDSQQRTDEMIKIGAVAAVAVILLFMFLRSTRSASVSGAAPVQLEAHSHSPLSYLEEEQDDLIEQPMTIEEALGEMPLPSASPTRSRSKRKPLVPEIEEHMDVKLESVRDMAKNHPASVALLMKGWMADEVESVR